MRGKERLSTLPLPQNGPLKALGIGIPGLLPRGQAIPNPTQLFARGYTQDPPASKVGPKLKHQRWFWSETETPGVIVGAWCRFHKRGGVGPSRCTPGPKKKANKKGYIPMRRPSDIMVGKTGNTKRVIRGLNSGKGLR